MKILTRYILKEYLGNLMLGLGIFTFVLILDQLFELIDLIVNKGVGVVLTFQLLALLIPATVSLTLPISNLLAALLTFGYFSELNEITAMRASGLAVWTYVRGPLAVGVLSIFFLLPFNNIWAPHAHSFFRSIYLEILQRNPLVRFEERTFSTIGDYRLFIEKKEKRRGGLRGVSIYKAPPGEAPLRIFAESGTASINPEKGIHLSLRQGHIEEVDPKRPDQWFHTSFETYDIDIPFGSKKNGASDKTIQEMDSQELQSRIKELKTQGKPFPIYACEKYLRSALAVAPLIFICLGIPLAIRVQRGGRSIGFGVSLVVVFLYYAMIMAGLSAGQRGLWPPMLATWLGNIVFSFLAAGLLWRFGLR